MGPDETDRLVRRYIPVIPDEFKIYDSYTVDPRWQTTFTIIWTSVLAFTTLLSSRYVYRSLRHGDYYRSMAISESSRSPGAGSTKGNGTAPGRTHAVSRGWTGVHALWQSVVLWAIPMPNVRFWKSQVGDCCRRAYFSLGVGEATLVLGYMAASIACFTAGAELLQNSNRPGFIALSQLPLIVLLSLKSPLPLPIFLPRLSYEHYNFLHRWSGRTLFLLVTVHGGLWLNQFISTNQMDQVWSTKTTRGMIAYGLMCGIVLTSLKPVRRVCYQVFWIAHLVLFVGFFAAISYHTPYSRPWIYPCVAIYGYDFVVRMLRYRLKSAIIVPVDPTMVMIHVPDCASGWKPTQHVLLRVMRGPGIFESHPFTIINAPSASSCSGITLYAKVAGDWTRRLHALASSVKDLEVGEDITEREAFLAKETSGDGEGLEAGHPGKEVMVMLDGPYGGLKIDLGESQRVLLMAGGSGITFALGAIEEAILAKMRGGIVQTVEVAWVVRDISTIRALSKTLPYLHDKSGRQGIELLISLYLSSPPTPLHDRLPGLPMSTSINPYRPEVAQLVRDSVSSLSDTLNSSISDGSGVQGGLAVVACGPEGIVLESRNAIASMGVKQRVDIGGIQFHGECYAL